MPNIYLIYWARLTDSPPLLIVVDMLKVSYYPAEKPFFVFDSDDVLSNFKAFPLCIEYECDDIMIWHMPAFTPICKVPEEPDDGDDFLV